MNNGRKTGRDYHNKLFKGLSENATLNDLRYRMNFFGSMPFYMNSKLLNEKEGLVFFECEDDEIVAEIVGFSLEEISLMNIDPNIKLLDLAHSIVHISTDSIHTPIEELRIIGGDIGLFNMPVQRFAAHWYNDHLLDTEEGRKLWKPLKKPEAIDCENIYFSAKIRQQGLAEGYFKIDMNINIHPIKDNVKYNEFAITPESFLEAAVRGRFARYKIIKASEYGEQIFIRYQPELRNVPAKAIYTENVEREFAWKIAQDKPVNIHDVRIPLTVVQINEVKELAAMVRGELKKMAGRDFREIDEKIRGRFL